MKILQSLLYGLALAGPQQDDTEEMCGGVSRISKKNLPKSRFKNRICVKFRSFDLSAIFENYDFGNRF